MNDAKKDGTWSWWFCVHLWQKLPRVCMIPDWFHSFNVNVPTKVSLTATRTMLANENDENSEGAETY